MKEIGQNLYYYNFTIYEYYVPSHIDLLFPFYLKSCTDDARKIES